MSPRRSLEDQQPRSALDRYVLGPRLASGGMAKVHLGNMNGA